MKDIITPMDHLISAIRAQAEWEEGRDRLLLLNDHVVDTARVLVAQHNGIDPKCPRCGELTYNGAYCWKCGHHGGMMS